MRLDDHGHYDVMLGSTESDGIPLNLFASGEPRWLGVQALIPGEDEQSRALLVSVPYALQAQNAQTLGGLPASAFARVGSNSGTASSVISNTTIGVPESAVSSNSPATTSATKLDVTATGGTTNTIPKFSGPSSLVNSQIADQNGTVTMQNLANILFADQFTGGVPAAVNACPASGCIIYAVSPNVNLNLGTIDPGSKVITIYLGPYTYTVNQITLRSGLKIIGMGGTETIL
ncbi:MAG: hypothetical protein WBW49_06655, partial [Candidatus Acidiferrum sp.]